MNICVKNRALSYYLIYFLTNSALKISLLLQHVIYDPQPDLPVWHLVSSIE